MPLSLGFWCIYRRCLRPPELAARLAAILTDERWPWQPSLVRPGQAPNRELYPWPKGKVRGSALRATIEDLAASDRVTRVNLSLSRKEHLNHAWVYVETGDEWALSRDHEFPLLAAAICRLDGMPKGKTIDGWLEAMHQLVQLVEAPHGVIWAAANEAPISAYQFGVGSYYPDKPADHPHNETPRIVRVRKTLGSQWVRPPQWGTYLSAQHVAAIGGLERLRAAVDPPIVRDLGGRFYVQLSAAGEDAVGPEAERRRRALTELLAPITVPMIEAA